MALELERKMRALMITESSGEAPNLLFAGALTPAQMRSFQAKTFCDSMIKKDTEYL